MSVHLIRIIAFYEMRTLLRSWFFRIFAGGAIMGLGIFNIALNVESSGAPWMYKALAASIPYANLIILNLGQAVVAVFLASEFLKQDRKNDTVEVIYARSMSNGQYILGKTLGILAVFLVLNIIILLMGIGFSFISNTTSQQFWAYLTYPMLISLPTLVFILGLAFFVMTLVKNQAVTFIVLTGYIALTVFYLNKKAFHLFDYIAYQVPMMYSSISGFARFDEILLHRSIYFLFGTGLIFFTVFKLQRLPQSPGQARLPLFLGMVMIVLGGLLTGRYLGMKQTDKAFRELAVTLNNRYTDFPRATVIRCDLNLRHSNSQIFVDAGLTIRNDQPGSLDTLIFSLNPGLLVETITSSGKELDFSREHHLLKIVPDSPMLQGDSCILKIQYNGSILENICFLDRYPRTFEENYHYEVFTLRKRFAFLQKNFVCLTSESLWYPVSGTTYAARNPMRDDPDFIRFSLQVTTQPGLTAVSQGEIMVQKEGLFVFRPEYPLPRISLVIGRYNQYNIQVDSVDYRLFVAPGHEYFSGVFAQLNDTLPALIRELKKGYEVSTGLTYPFNRLILLEVPVHFALETHVYAYASDAVQPEMLLCPEKGVLFDASDFRNRKFRLEKDMKANQEEASPEEIQARLFNQFVQNNFLAKAGQDYNYRDVVSWETFSLFPQYAGYFTRIDAPRWPVLNLAFETYLSERNRPAASIMMWYENLSQQEKVNLELSKASLDALLINQVETGNTDDQSVTLREITQAKGLYLFNMLRAKLGEREVDTLFTRLMADYPHAGIPFAEINNRFTRQFNISLEEEIRQWYYQDNLPGFLIRNIQNYKVMEGEATRFQVRLNLSNPENSEGMVTLNVELNDPNRQQGGFFQESFQVDFSRKIFIPARSSFDIGFVFNTEPARMTINTHISKNLPGNLLYNFSGFTETRNIQPLDKIVGIPFFDRVSGDQEIIVDNEDPGFSYKQTANQAYLKTLVNQRKEDRYKYSAIWAWNPPREWKAALRSEFNGYYVHSAHYTRGGNGERSATWKAALSQQASYDVYFYLQKIDVGWRRSNKASDYNFLVYHDQGVDKVNRSGEEAESGWNYLGTFTISSDTARVELTNNTVGDMIFADAVKWVLNK